MFSIIRQYFSQIFVFKSLTLRLENRNNKYKIHLFLFSVHFLRRSFIEWGSSYPCNCREPMYDLVWWLFSWLLQVLRWAKKRKLYQWKLLVTWHRWMLYTVLVSCALEGRPQVVTSALKSLRRDTVVQQLSCVRLPDWWKNIRAVRTNTSKTVLVIIFF